MMTGELRIGLVAGEASGDRLGAGLIASIRQRAPRAEFLGVGGPLMQAAGMTSLFSMEPLSVMGLVEPLKNLPTLLRMRRDLKRYFVDDPPDAFVGIDAPDFNLGLELGLRERGIPTVHYVSPSVWAWRQGRIRKIARAVDHMLTLLPFEAEFYRAHGVPVTFVGHPLADELPLQPDVEGARQQLGIPSATPVLALLPGSRHGEINQLGRLFLQVAERCRAVMPELELLLPAANPQRRRQIDTLLEGFPNLPVRPIDGNSHAVMAAANTVLLASGTTALEAMLLKKPMVVSYRTGWFSHAVISRMLKVAYVSLPNLLANERLVPELLQKQATVENLLAEVLPRLQEPARFAQTTQRFYRLHEQLRCDASNQAAAAILNLLAGRPASAPSPAGREI